MIHFLYAPLLSFLLLYAVWIFYLAVMSLKRAKDAGHLVPITKALGYPVLFVGLLLDLIGNVLIMTVLFWELPKEMTISARLKRHNRFGSGRRQRIAAWFEPILDPYDPSGDHI